MLARTRSLWQQQDRHPGDRLRLFSAIASAVSAERVLYPGCFVDVAASFVWTSVTYVDIDARAQRFFDDSGGVSELIAEHAVDPAGREVRFLQEDYRAGLALEVESFDLLISLYAGFISEHCTRYLRVGGHLFANPSHGDAALASLDPRYRLAGVVTSRDGDHTVSTRDLDSYLVPKSPDPVTRERLLAQGRGIAYTRSAFAYLFERVH